ncbi:hypothetical protein [Escherichia coli IS29]|nr:hypothetical protein [Escherichia coli IS29]
MLRCSVTTSVLNIVVNAQADVRRRSKRMNCLKAANVGNAGDQHRPSQFGSLATA